MANAIYSVKMFLFRSEYKSLTANQMNGLRDVCIFLATLYAPAWFDCMNASGAPNHDLKFIKKAINYAETDFKVSERVLSKFAGHLWYLSSEALGLAFFDDNVSTEEKRKMVEALKNEPEPDDSKRLIVKPNEMETFKHKPLHAFVSQNTLKFFKRFRISTEFLKRDPSEWSEFKEYTDAVEFVTKMSVVNDIAERNVKLFEEYNTDSTKDEEQKQFLMHGRAKS